MLDREALGAEILAWYTAQKPDLDLADLVDRIAELVRSEPGVTLTPEEAALALRWKREAVRHGYVIDIPDDDLAERLGAATS